MRVRGNIEPRALDIELHPQRPAFCIVTLRANIRPFTETDGQSGAELAGYEYDEYSIPARYYDSLQHDIEADWNNWLATGRTLEFNASSSEALDLRDEINAADSDMAALVNMIYTNDLEVIG